MARILLITIDALESPSKTAIKTVAVDRKTLDRRQYAVNCNEVVVKERLRKYWKQVAATDFESVYQDMLEELKELGYVVTSERQSPGGSRYPPSWLVHHLSETGQRALHDETCKILPAGKTANNSASGRATRWI
jgi:hypothetical protein